jgi:hypothetical protein
MPITGSLTIPQQVISIDLRRAIVDFDAQRFIFQCEFFTKSYDPTQGEWNYVRTGMTTLINRIANLTNISIDTYDASKHPNPGQFEN